MQKKTLLATFIGIFLLSHGGAQTCNPVYNLGISTPTATRDTMTWTTYHDPNVVSYEVLVNTSSAAPSGSGIMTTDTFYYASGLTPSTTYYVHLRAKCSNGAFSTWWGGPPFTTQHPSALANTPEEARMIITPNPATDKISVRGTEGTVRLADIHGRIVRTAITAGNDLVMDIADLPQGVYIASYTTQFGNYAIKLVKE